MTVLTLLTFSRKKIYIHIIQLIIKYIVLLKLIFEFEILIDLPPFVRNNRERSQEPFTVSPQWKHSTEPQYNITIRY